MAEYISFQPSDYFNPVGYTGTASGAKVVTGVGFQPDNIFFKLRSGVYAWAAIDAVRGVTKILECDANAAENTNSNYLASFDSDGFSTTATQDTATNSSGTYMGFSWKAGTTSGIATDGSTTITPSSYSFDQTAGISIIKYTGNSTSGAKLAHGLGAIPKWIIIKNLDATEGWTVYHEALGNTKYLALNTTAAADTQTNRWNDTSPDSVNITLGDSSGVNTQTYIAYCFSEIRGYSKFGSYTGYDTSDGPFIYTGFRPAMVLIKRTSAGAWWLNNSTVNPINITSLSALRSNSTAAETTDSSETIDVLSNGFKLRSNGGDINYSGVYFYMAFAEFPLVSSNNVPGVAR
jgi:hypothetical protein